MSGKIFIDTNNDLKPGDYVNGIYIKKDGTKAFTVYKTGDTEENHIYWYSPTDNGNWKLEKKESKPGKKVEPVKLKKLNEFLQEREQSPQN